MRLRLLTITLTAVAVFAALISAASTFLAKRAAEEDARAIARLQRSIAAERQRISELRAEWSALDNPARLTHLHSLHGEALDLRPISAEQIVTVADVAKAAQRPVEDNEREEAEQ